MKIRNFEVELADDFSDFEAKGRREAPYYKRWRCWANGVYLGDIIKNKNANGEPSYKIAIHKANTGDQYHYERTISNGAIKYVYHRDGVKGKKDERKYDGYSSLKEAGKAFQQFFLEDIEHLVNIDPEIPF